MLRLEGAFQVLTKGTEFVIMDIETYNIFTVAKEG